MRKRYLVSALIVTGMLAAGAALRSQPPHHGPGRGAGHGPGLLQHIHEHLHQHLAALELTGAQREAVHGVLQARRAEIAGAIRPLLTARRTLHDAVMADRPDDAAIRAAAATLGAAAGNAAVTIARIKVEVVEKAKLTPEQKQKIADFRADAAAAVDEAIKALEGGGEKHPK